MFRRATTIGVLGRRRERVSSLRDWYLWINCIRLGHHPELWKTAKGIVIPKPGKPDYSKVRAYRVICLLDVISKLVERMVGHLIADHLERKKVLHEGQ